MTDELLDPMLNCVRPGDPFVEYGIVEYRLSQHYPELYVAHIRDRGHVMLKPSRVTAPNSRFGPALVRLARAGRHRRGVAARYCAGMAHSRLTAEMVVDGRVPRGPALSPDGRRVAYVVAPGGQTGAHPVAELWIAGTGPPQQEPTGEASVSAPRWAADGQHLYFLSDRARRGEAQLHRTGRTDPLTSWPGGVSDHLPLADPELIALVAADEPSTEDRVLARGEDPRPDRLRLLDLRTGHLRTPAGLGDRHVVALAERPGGGPLAVLSWATAEIDPEPRLHVLDPVSGRVHDLGPAAADASSPVWWAAADGWHVAYLGKTPPALVGGSAVLDVAVPAGGLRNLTAGLTGCPTHLVQTGTGPPLVLVADGLDTAIHRLDPAGQPAEVLRVTGSATALSTDRAGVAVAVIVSTAYQPGDVHTGPAGGPLTRVTDLRPELRAVRWGVQERLSYRAADGLDLDGLLVLPPGRSRADGPFPLVTLVHGGPYDRHADRLQLDWDPSGQWLAAAGYAVFLPNPRGGLGHGHDFAARAAGAVGLGEWTDIGTGIDLLVAAGVADPGRLGIGGWSHGGFLAAWAVGQSDRFRAAVMGAGISDWGMLAATGEEGPFEAALAGGNGWDGPGPHRHDRLSPISYAGRVRTPVLILHGERDTNVPVSQAEYFHRALRHFGVEHEYVVYPREPHALRERRHQLDVLRRTLQWFDRWLG